MKFNSQSVVESNVLELVWNNTNEAIFIIGYDGRILTANPSFTAILGWEETDFREDSCFPFFADNSPEEHQKQLTQFKRGHDIPYYVTRRKRKDGVVLDILASYRAINNGEVLAVGMYKDFSEHMNIQRRLQASEDCYRNLVEFIPDAIFVESNGKIAFVNSPGISLVGAKSAQEVIGQSVWQFIRTDDKITLKAKIQQVISTKEPIIERLLRFDGETIWVEIIAMAIVFEGESVIQILLRDITSKKKYDAQLEFLAFHDPLTGLTNRRYFTTQINQAIENAEKKNHMLAVMYIDIDKFKRINDSLGHDVGDQLLKQFANRLKEHVREEDVLCRIGGDEFLILLNGLKDKKIALEIVSRLHKAFQVPYLIDNQRIVATSSIGFAMFPENGIDSKILISRSDAALYLAKEQRNVFQFY